MTPEAPVTEAGRVSARETMVHRLEAAVRRHGVTVAPNVWLDDLDAIEAEAVARDREALAAKVRGLPIRSKMTDAEFNVAVPHGFLSRDAVLAHVDRPALAATPSPAPTAPLDVEDGKYGPRVRSLREGQRLTGRALCRVVSIAPSYLSDIEVGRRLPAPEVSDRIADALGTDRDGLWRLALLERLSERDLRTLATPDQRHMGSGSLDERANG